MNTTDKYQSLIHSLLSQKRFQAGREIVEELMSSFKVSNDNARKILQRSVELGIINSSKPITFGKGQFVYMLPGEHPDMGAIKAICKVYRPPLYRILEILEINEGIISHYEALKLSASSEEKTSSKSNTVNELIKTLVDLDLVDVATDENSIKYIISKEILEPIETMAVHYSKMVLDTMFLPDILRWLRKVNLIDNIKTIYRNKQNPAKGALHNNLIWDAFAYTKTTGINGTIGKNAITIEKQTLVVLDVVINRDYNQEDLDGFLGRVQVNINSVKQGKRKVMPIIFYKNVSEKVLNTANSLGFMSFDIGSVFGSRIYEIIENINSIQKATDSFTEKAFQKEISKTLSTIRISGQEENLSNLKGTLFEYLLYPVLNTLFGSASVTHGKTLSEKKEDGSKEGYEYDFIIRSENPKELIVVEAKGYSHTSSIPLGDPNTKNTLNWFFGRTLPFLKKQYQQELSDGYRLKASYITSANFYDSGFKFLESQTKFKSKKLNTHYDGNTLIQLLNDNDFTHIRKTIERYYIKKQTI